MLCLGNLPGVEDMNAKGFTEMGKLGHWCGLGALVYVLVTFYCSEET